MVLTLGHILQRFIIFYTNFYSLLGIILSHCLQHFYHLFFSLFSDLFLTRNHIIWQKSSHFNDLSPHSGHQICYYWDILRWMLFTLFASMVIFTKNISLIFTNDYLLGNHWWVQSHYPINFSFTGREPLGNIPEPTIYHRNGIWLIKQNTLIYSYS